MRFLLFVLFGLIKAADEISNRTCGQIESCEVVKELQSLVASLLDRVNALEGKTETLEDIVMPVKIPASCHHLASYGTPTDGYYTIQPAVDVNPFEVYCEFHGNVGTTVIKHDHDSYGFTSIPLQSGGCAEPGCYTDSFGYNASMTQIDRLIQISSDCTQSIVNNCTNSQLTGMSWWTDRNNNDHQYWHGSYENNTIGCFCSLEGTGCADTHYDDLACNCDDFDEFNVDEGVLSSRSQLPVVQLNYGDSSSRYSWILYDLGHLKCEGRSMEAVYPSELDSVDYYFKFYSSSSWSMKAGSYINMDKMYMDRSLGLYDESTGTFTAAVDGRYQFDLHMVTGIYNEVYHLYTIHLEVNGNTVEKFRSYRSSYNQYTSSSSQDSNFYSTELNLSKGQVLQLYVEYTYGTHQTESGCFVNGEDVGCSFFQGKLIQRY